VNSEYPTHEAIIRRILISYMKIKEKDSFFGKNEERLQELGFDFKVN
jgi:hypothetical protein